MSEVTSDAASPYTGGLWEPATSDLKTYRHFDSVLSPSAIAAMVRDAEGVAVHPFRPLLHFEKKWRRAPKNGVARGPKVRPIRYACRKDAYIYKHYRGVLSAAYEAELKDSALRENVLAYRRIPISVGCGSYKSNINFAKDAFDIIASMENCCAIALDISDFFGSIDHAILKQVWMRLLGCDRLPNDHFSVYSSVTDYRFVDLNEALVALGYSEKNSNGHLTYLRDPRDIPVQLCSPREYRAKIIEGGLVQKHERSYGIPQGTPLSDLLANAYLLQFDVAMKAYANRQSGFYFRYSDDIPLLLPSNETVVNEAFSFAVTEMAKMGPQLQINRSKTEITCFSKDGASRCRSFELNETIEPSLRRDKHGDPILNAGFSYLGFRYDGKNVYLRDSTLANLRGKIARTCKSEAFYFVRRHKEKNLDWLLRNAPIDHLRQRYLDVENFEEAVAEAREGGNSIFAKMTFWSYVRRASKTFGKQGRPISRQLRRISSMIERQFLREIRSKYRLVHY